MIADRGDVRGDQPRLRHPVSRCAILTRSSNARDHPGLTASRPGHRVGLDGNSLAWGDRRDRTTDRSRIPNRSFATTNLKGKVGCRACENGRRFLSWGIPPWVKLL